MLNQFHQQEWSLLTRKQIALVKIITKFVADSTRTAIDSVAVLLDLLNLSRVVKLYMTIIIVVIIAELQLLIL